MRTRAILLVVAILLVAAFAALNWGEIVHTAPLSFGLFVTDAPMGAILLALLALAAVAFALSAATIRTQALVDYRNHHKTLEQQRTLADKAEASRFTDLRQHLDSQLRDLRERDSVAATEFEKAMVQSQRELRTQLEQVNRTVAARLTELEHRLDARFASGVAAPAVRAETGQSQQLRDAQLREDQLRARAEQERARAGQEQAVRQEQQREERAMASDRPAESGWRKWF
ncbi:hypothetical protein HHL11_31420 [Ramlibacter sp. G-1-2-2]|uniref:LapA family protein n=1 Tax=Ramlibacter agri TaxID=2728837 RepID=A0A848HG44_9BURK|nr:hypothetical protein [Ramlibacter agri]NML48301.1 hypothetical protein [Ramlibacter agri]